MKEDPSKTMINQAQQIEESTKQIVNKKWRGTKSSENRKDIKQVSHKRAITHMLTQNTQKRDPKQEL
jgi:hypothetical protein